MVVAPSREVTERTETEVMERTDLTGEAEKRRLVCFSSSLNLPDLIPTTLQNLLQGSLGRRDSFEICRGLRLALTTGHACRPSSIQRRYETYSGGCDRGPSNARSGLLESVYVACLHFELSAQGLRFVTERAVPIVYKGMSTGASYRVDLIVEDLVVVEVKSLAAVLPVHQSQVLTYMGLAECPAGLLINFNVPRLMDGVKRLINPRASAKR